MMQFGLRKWQEAGRDDSRPALTLLPLVAAIAGAIALGTAAHAAETGVTMSHPWMRTIIPSRPAAGYFTLSNDSATTRALTGAQSPACGTLMLHKSISENGVERMVMEKRIPVPAHGQLTFAPGGYHLMCMQPTKEVRPGNSVPVTLKFADGGTLTASFPVRGISGK
jgi:periplasmic copper chaperone A